VGGRRVASGLLALLLWFAYQRGYRTGVAIGGERPRRRELLNRNRRARERERHAQRQDRGARDVTHAWTSEAYGQVERTLGELQSAMSRESDDLAFYRSIVSPADGIAGCAFSGSRSPRVPRTASSCYA
jgi:hypothetical protein